jgi:uncharacterized protein YdeI (YjbR/CyaY-like superfamily)
MADIEIVAPKDRAAWRRWLQRHHERPDGVWLLIRKKGSVRPGVTYDEAVEEALCFGWIDSTTNRHDDDHFRQRFAPRKRGSTWSASNKARVERLIAEGLMTPAGSAKIDAAKADGSWNALDGLEDLSLPDDLAEALDANPPAREHFESFPPGTRKQILFWIRNAKRVQTRATRVARTAEAAARNVRVSDWRPGESA